MARVVVVPAATEDLTQLILTQSLPTDTRERVRRSLRPLSDFPLLGAQLDGRWGELRFILGPWRWMVILYAFDRENDVASIVSIADGRAFNASISR